MNIRNTLRMLLMPGFDLFTRRRVRLCRYWKRGSRSVLDAGFGNGWFSYLACRSGATVTAVSFDPAQVHKATAFYNDWLGIPRQRLAFRQLNLYEVESVDSTFDEIICYETLEHVREDSRVCRTFWEKLNPGGMLHLCCPFAEHPRWRSEPLDREESGYHVRAGYTLESYRRLLEPIGFSIEQVEGMGGRLLSGMTDAVQWVRNRWGDPWCLPLFAMALPMVSLDSRNVSCPYSLYVGAAKKGGGA